VNIRFKNGEIHRIDLKGSIRSLRNIKLKCGLTVKGIVSTKHAWYFTFRKPTCKHCIKKVEPKRVVRSPTDLSNYHTFIKDD